MEVDEFGKNRKVGVMKKTDDKMVGSLAPRRLGQLELDGYFSARRTVRNEYHGPEW